jgi:hypothetical protein
LIQPDQTELKAEGGGGGGLIDSLYDAFLPDPQYSCSLTMLIGKLESGNGRMAKNAKDDISDMDRQICSAPQLAFCATHLCKL